MAVFSVFRAVAVGLALAKSHWLLWDGTGPDGM